MTRKDLTGKRFGKLYVLEMQYGVLIGKRKRSRCVCVCDCGNTVSVNADLLTSGRKISCGCDTFMRRSTQLRKDLTGRIYGRLTVIEMDWSQKPTKAVCKCQCGKVKMIIARELSSGKTQSCGCLQAERASEANTKNWSGSVSRYGVKLLCQEKMNEEGQWLWRCECGICGNEFIALPAKIMNGHITSCGCRRQSSKEQLISSELDSLHVDYREQYTFSDCRDKLPLPFDFAVFFDEHLEVLIEYDGQQHYRPIPLFGGVNSFDITKKHDKIKNEFCRQKSLKLIRLPYTLSDDEIKSIIRDIIIRRDCNVLFSNEEDFAMLPHAG